MKSHCARKWPGLILLFGLLSGGCLNSFALGPRQHAIHGMVEDIDHTKRTLLLIDVKTHARRVFVWNNSTRFRHDGKKIRPEALRPGVEVKGYYRKEVGRFVLRELRWSNTGPRTSGTAIQPNSKTALAESKDSDESARGSRLSARMKERDQQHAAETAHNLKVT